MVKAVTSRRCLINALYSCFWHLQSAHDLKYCPLKKLELPSFRLYFSFIYTLLYILMLIKFKKNPLAGIAMHILVEANSHEWIFGGQTYLCANKFWYLVCFPDFNAQISKAHLQSGTVWPNHIISILTKQLLFKRIVFKLLYAKIISLTQLHAFWRESKLSIVIFNPFNYIQSVQSDSEQNTKVESNRIVL